MRHFFLCLIILSWFASTAAAQRTPVRLKIDTIATLYRKEQHKIKMRDGITLFTTVYIPRDAGPNKKYPMIMNRTPYNCAPYHMAGKGIPNDSIYSEKLTRYMTMAKEGYIFVFQDVRGRYLSEGNFVDVTPHNPDKKTNKDTDESSDTYDSIDWLVANIPNNNGNVGIMGISYPGFYSSSALPGAHPSLKAVSPQAPVTDWFIGDDFHHNGAMCLADAFEFFYSFGKVRIAPTEFGQKDYEYPVEDIYAFHLKMGAIPNYNTQILHNQILFWENLIAHPNYDDYWQAKNIRPHLKNVKPAVMTVGGVFDAEDTYGAFATYQAIEKQNPGADNILVMGPWWHGQWARDSGAHIGNIRFGQRTTDFYSKEIESAFFRHHLKGGTDPKLPEAYVFTSGNNLWNQFDHWPPRQAIPKTIYLQPKNELSTVKPSIKQAFSSYFSDPSHPVPYTEDVHLYRTREYMTDDQRFASRRPDVLTFQSEMLTDTAIFTGPIKAKIYISTLATDCDIVVKIIDVFPDDAKTPQGQTVPMSGYQMLVRGEIMRVRYRESFEKPSPLIPDSITLVEFTLPDIAHAYLPGHRIMVQIQSSWFPLMDRNPQQFINIYEARDEDFLPALIKIHHDVAHPSGIEFMQISHE
jgi:uncharacterized protein